MKSKWERSFLVAWDFSHIIVTNIHLKFFLPSDATIIEISLLFLCECVCAHNKSIFKKIKWKLFYFSLFYLKNEIRFFF